MCIACARQSIASEEADTIRSVWRYLRDEVSRHIPSCVHRQLSRIESDLPWLNAPINPETEARVVLGPGSDVVMALRQAIGNDKVSTLFVISPFFDARVAALERTIRQLRPNKTILLLQPHTVSVDGDRLAKYKNLEAYEIKCDSFVHGKVVIAECGRRSVVIAGSHNVSTPAFDGNNFEVGLIRVAQPDSRFSKALRLTDYVSEDNRICLATAGLKYRTDKTTTGTGGNFWLTSAHLEGGYLEVITRTPLHNSCRLVPFRANGPLEPLTAVPQITGEILRFVVPKTVAHRAWVAISVVDADKRSEPVPLLHVAALESRARSTKELEVSQRIKQLRSDLTELPDLLSSVSALLMAGSEKPVQRPSARHSKKQVSPQHMPRKLPYEDFVVPWIPQGEHLHAPAARPSNLELVVAAISRAIEGGDATTDELNEENEETDADVSLAKTTQYEEEALANDALEKNPGVLAEQLTGGIIRDKPDSGALDTPRDLQQEKVRSLERAKTKLRHFATKFPMHLIELAQADKLQFDLFEKLCAVASLMMQFLGRQVTAGKVSIELLNVDTWGDFNVELFNVLSSSEIRFLERFDWKSGDPELYRSAVERFLGYVAAVERLCRLETVGPGKTARILVGLVRFCRLMGVSKAIVREKYVAEAARAFIDLIGSTSIPRPILQWSRFVKSVAKITELDTELRARYRDAAAIAATKSGQQLCLGDWVWWPHVEGHVGVVIATDASKAEIAYEPKATKLVSTPYVLPLKEIIPATSPRSHRALAAY